MTNLQYILYSIAAALMKAGESLKDSADNVPAGIGFSAPDSDGVIHQQTGSVEIETTNTAPPAVDSAGFPWDERIHSGAKSIKKDGTWTYRKNTPPTVIATVEAELKGKGTATAPGVPLGTAPALTLPGAPTLALVPPKLTKFQELVAFLAANTGPGKAADDAWVNASLAQSGTSMIALQTADDATIQVWIDGFKSVLTPAA